MAQSLAREFHPKGVHVAHALIDGLIDTERVQGMMGEVEPGVVSLSTSLLLLMLLIRLMDDSD